MGIIPKDFSSLLFDYLCMCSNPGVLTSLTLSCWALGWSYQMVDLLLCVSLVLRSILHAFVTGIRAALLSSLNGI